ncbi:hypothetical protein [Mesorhizobium sp. B4-1-1]|uniref:hypothetical protein n=1 Tax=Mesorhizobium sp. B4-1-1 TaxID=2589890 RepID=UPI001128FFE2|nr:hypothetical protein [Mesorhizobium sp. B4-1-1]TPI09174.1 hypothetical protein FJW10_30290 [Mesorhizobium sp. B4-1-1]
MARKSNTLDLFRDYEPTNVVERFEPEKVHAWNLAGRLSKAVSLTLSEAQQPRADIAKAMSDYLKDEVSKAMLDAYASQAKEHSISALRLAALVSVTNDVRALNTLLEDAGMIVVPKKFEALIMREMADEAIERATRDRQAFDAQWRAKR